MALTERRRTSEDDTQNASILIIDDDESTRVILSALLKDMGYNIETAEDGDIGIKLFLPLLLIFYELLP